MTKVSTLDELEQLARGGKSIVSSRGQRMPAAFVYSMQASRVHLMLKEGLTVYQPKERTKTPWA